MDREKRVSDLIARINRERGFSRDWRNLLAEKDPDFCELYHETCMHVLHRRKALSPKFKELLCLAIDIATNYEQGIRIHVRHALNEGATEEEILETLEITQLLGYHTISLFLPVIDEEIQQCKAGKKEQTGNND